VVVSGFEPVFVEVDVVPLCVVETAQSDFAVSTAVSAVSAFLFGHFSTLFRSVEALEGVSMVITAILAVVVFAFVAAAVFAVIAAIFAAWGVVSAVVFLSLSLSVVAGTRSGSASWGGSSIAPSACPLSSSGLVAASVIGLFWIISAFALVASLASPFVGP